jgi:hypothetical protein
MNSAVVIAIVVIGVILFTLRYGASISGAGKKSEDELFLLCRGDKDMLERLIAREQKRNGSLSRSAAAKAAVYSIKRDNR